MYHGVLLLHSWNRWLVLLAMLTALGLAYHGWLARRSYGRADRLAGGVLTGALHLQLLLGLLLYSTLSPWTQLAFRDWAAAWKSPELRFWAVEHVGLMISGVVLAQVGHSLAKRASSDIQRHRRAALCYSAALGLLLLGIPFAARPWLRG
jgi:hypothetical protein